MKIVELNIWIIMNELDKAVLIFVGVMSNSFLTDDEKLEIIFKIKKEKN